VVKALCLSPCEPQDGLKPISIFGNEAYRIDPLGDDFYKWLIDLRSAVKARRDNACGAKREELDAEEKALKTVANATSYGIFVELIVEELEKKETLLCFGSGDDGFPVDVDKVSNVSAYETELAD
jgi:hypothetical protein